MEFDKFFESGGICYAITSSNSLFDWCPFIDKLKMFHELQKATKNNVSTHTILNRSLSTITSVF